MDDESDSTERVKVVTEIGFSPWKVPGFAIIRPGEACGGEGLSIRVADLSREAIDALAGKWLDNLYATQARPSPWTLNRKP